MAYFQQHVIAEGENPASSSYMNAEFTYAYNAINTVDGKVDAHIADTTDAHDASAISVADAGNLLTATTVEAALAELHADVTNHTGDTSAAHAASAISVLDTAGNFTGTNVEAVLAEVQADLDGRFSTGTGHDHDGTDSAKIPESSLNLTDVTTGNVSTSKHGFCPKAPGDTGKFLRGDGTWAAVTVDVVGHSGFDATEYSHTGNTSYTLKKTFTFTPTAASFGTFVFSLQMKTSTAGTGNVRVDVDDVSVFTANLVNTVSYTTKPSTAVVALPMTAAEHTVKVYLQVTDGAKTVYVRNIYFAYIGVKTA